jgi:hypothetical protein
MTRFALACQIQLATATQPQRPDVRRPGLTVCAALLVVAGVSTGAWAEGAAGAAAVVTRTADEPLPLRPSALLTDRLVPDAQAGAPSFVWGDAISGKPGERTLDQRPCRAASSRHHSEG